MLSSKVEKPQISVSAVKSLVDAPVDIAISGVKPGQEVTIRANRVTESKNYLYFSSFATFIADNDGKVDLNNRAPINGSYSGIDGMGLFWSLEINKIEERKKNSSKDQILPPQVITFALEIENKVVDEIRIERLWKAENLSRESVRENGLVGTFFYENQKPKPAIIVLGGSEGGLNEHLGALIASKGFTVLVLAYFGVESLPKRLVKIPVEYIRASIDWIKNRPEAKNGWLGIHGSSRGSELALLSASLYSDINAVVTLSGSAISFSGIVPWSDEEKLPPAWTHNGNPIPYATSKNPINTAIECRRLWKNKAGNPLEKWYKALTADKSIVEKATIQVEKINGSILLISGNEDITVNFSRRAIERLEKHNFQNEYKHLIYDGAGHSLGIPYVYCNQGKKKETAYASVDSWKKTIDFYLRSANTTDS